MVEANKSTTSGDGSGFRGGLSAWQFGARTRSYHPCDGCKIDRKRVRKKLEFSKIRRTTDFALLCSVKGEFLVRDAVGGTGLVRWRDSPGSSTT